VAKVYAVPWIGCEPRLRHAGTSASHTANVPEDGAYAETINNSEGTRMVHTLLISVFLILSAGCAKTPTTEAKKYVDSWADMGMWLPEKGQVSQE